MTAVRVLQRPVRVGGEFGAAEDRGEQRGRSMKIRQKLLFAFGLFILLAVAGGVFSFRQVETITRRLALVEAADDMSNVVLEVRRYEKNFLIYKAEADMRELQVQLEILREDMDGLFREIIKESGVESYSHLQGVLSDYRRTILLLAEQFRAIEPLEREVENRGSGIEWSLKDDDLKGFLTLRSIEKNLRINRDGEAFGAFTRTFEALGFSGRSAIADYRRPMEELARLYRNEASLTESLRIKGRQLHSFAAEFSGKERRGIERILRLTRYRLAAVLLLVIVFGTVISIKLATSIATPLANLERVTRKIAQGDFSESIAVKGADEIASLETTFNQMEDRLKETFSSLELAIKNLHEKQEQLIEAEKLASIGTLAAGVAHEINNPLAIINEKAGLIQDFLGSAGPFSGKERVLSLLEGVGQSVKRCSTITHRLLGFARRMDVVPESLDLDDTLREVLDFLDSEILFKDIHVERTSNALFPITSDREQLQQVFLNIIKNAVDATDRGGHIWISTAPFENRAVLVSIRDDGPGISKERLRRIFEPFFTTKDRTKGTGLGLSVSYGLMRKLGGTIRVESEVGVGTTFTVEVPVQTTV